VPARRLRAARKADNDATNRGSGGES